MKPSEARESALLAFNKRIAGRDLSELKQADLLAGEMIGALFEYLDDEHERQVAFEADVIARLVELERGTSEERIPGKMGETILASGTVHIGHNDSLTRYGTGHPSERCCKLCGKPTFDQSTQYSVGYDFYCDVDHMARHRGAASHWVETSRLENGREYSIATSYLDTPKTREDIRRVAGIAAAGDGHPDARKAE